MDAVSLKKKYTISTSAAATPTLSPSGGTYTTAQTVTISDTTSGATIYYTTNGARKTVGSGKNTEQGAGRIIEKKEAIEVATGYSHSGVGEAAYTLT